jgi:predicted nuclease with TOPRIM domain
LSGAGANTDQASRSLQDLTARQTELQNKIKEAILNGQDYQQELRELRNVQSELNQVQETYNRLLGEEKQATEEVRNNGSIAALRAQLAEIDQQIAETTSRERLEALINQRQTVEAGIQALEEQIEQIREESIRAGDDYFDA